MRFAVFAAAWLMALSCLVNPSRAEPVVLAAASTRQVVEVSLSQGANPALASYGASGVLARQIEQGAPADLYISANPKWMQYLVDAGMVDAEDVSVLMSNRLVLIAPEGSATTTESELSADWPQDGFAMADPGSAPVGSYGKAALETLGLWPQAKAQLIPTRNTMATVAAVARGEVALGLVYASDALGQPGVQVVWQIPEAAHPPIRYLIAPVAQGADPQGAEALLTYLKTPEGREVLTRFGFLPVAEGS